MKCPEPPDSGHFAFLETTSKRLQVVTGSVLSIIGILTEYVLDVNIE